jgi:uncharacterized membrane protein
MRTLLLRIAADFGPRPGRGGRFHHPGLVIVGLLLLGAVITLAILLYRSRHASAAVANVAPPQPPAPWSPSIAAETILAERFARGEVSVEEFVAARDALRN